jgi:carboxymethylenebutenolidase
MTDVMIPATHGDMPAYLANPPVPGPWPGVVVIHDARGMSHDLRNQASRLRARGSWPWRPTCSTGAGNSPACASSCATGAPAAVRPTMTSRPPVPG